MSTDTPGLSPAAPLAAARIDWGRGRLVGYAVPPDGAEALEVVRLLLDEQCLFSVVADRSVFDPAFGLELAGLPLPAREQSGFELRIPGHYLLPGHLGPDGVRLRLQTARGETLLDQPLHQAHELLRLAESAPVDLLYRARFSHAEAGRVFGSVTDLHGLGACPYLLARLNEQPAEPVEWLTGGADGEYPFAITLSPEGLQGGANQLTLVSETGQPLASFPIALGAPQHGESDRRIAALEAEVAFLKHLALNPLADSLPARLALLKSELVNLCSDMLALQRTQLEREIRAGHRRPDPEA